MRYIKLTFQYMFNKHFWKLMLLLLLPAIAVAHFTSFSTTAEYIVGFLNLSPSDLSSFASIYRITSEVVNRPVLIAGLVAAFVVYTLLFTMFIGTIRRHMRTGTFAITDVFKRINENLWPSFLTILFIFVGIFVFGLLMALSTFFWWQVTKSIITTFVLTIISMVLLFIVLVWAFAITSQACPNMVCTGQGVMDSLSVSIHSSRKQVIALMLAIALPIVLFMVLEFAAVFLQFRAFSIIVDTLALIVVTCYYPILVFVSYYDINEKDREDLSPVNNL